MTRTRAAFLAVVFGLLGLGLGWLLRTVRSSLVWAHANTPAAASAVQAEPLDLDPTRIYAHNVELRKGPTFRVYVSWISGRMLRTHPAIVPSFDQPDSFVLEIEKGVVRANIGDIANFLDADMPKNSPLKNIKIRPDGDQLVLNGTVHKIFPLPIELKGTLQPTADGRVRFHLSKIDVLKLPLKGLLGAFHVGLSDMVHGGNIPGVEIAGDDIYFDTQKLLPPPHIHGHITAVKVHVPDIEVVYGGVTVDNAELARWHNFLRFRGGTLGFGKLTMHNVDLTLIDASPDPWFDLDLVNYQAQLVNGYTRMTSQAGLEIYMPNFGKGAPPKQAVEAVSMDTLRNRNEALPKAPGK